MLQESNWTSQYPALNPPMTFGAERNEIAELIRGLPVTMKRAVRLDMVDVQDPSFITSGLATARLTAAPVAFQRRAFLFFPVLTTILRLLMRRAISATFEGFSFVGTRSTAILFKATRRHRRNGSKNLPAILASAKCIMLFSGPFNEASAGTELLRGIVRNSKLFSAMFAWAHYFHRLWLAYFGVLVGTLASAVLRSAICAGAAKFDTASLADMHVLATTGLSHAFLGTRFLPRVLSTIEFLAANGAYLHSILVNAHSQEVWSERYECRLFGSDPRPRPIISQNGAICE